MATEKPKLAEYKWTNGLNEMTGLLTEEQAERAGAERVGDAEGGVEPRRPQQMGLEADGEGAKDGDDAPGPVSMAARPGDAAKTRTPKDK